MKQNEAIGTLRSDYLGGGREMMESGDNDDRLISAGRTLIEQRAKGYAREFDVDPRYFEVGWYRMPGGLSMYPYIFSVSNGRTPLYCRFSEEELASFVSGNREAEARLRALVQELGRDQTAA
jgi:hypothetical protein